MCQIPGCQESSQNEKNKGSNDHALIKCSVFVCRVIMVMVWGQIFSREVVITSLLSKGIPYGSVRLEVHTNMGSTVGLVRGRTVVGRWSKVVAKGHLIVGKAGCCVTEHDPVIPAKSTDMADVNVGSCHGSCKCH